jgi:hypothetical protein
MFSVRFSIFLEQNSYQTSVVRTEVIAPRPRQHPSFFRFSNNSFSRNYQTTKMNQRMEGATTICHFDAVSFLDIFPLLGSVAGFEPLMLGI